MTAPHKPSAGRVADLLCDNCTGITSRLIIVGRADERRFLCDECAGTTAGVFCRGKHENDAVRLLHLAEVTRAMRKQNVRHGLLSPQKYAALERWHPDGW